MRLDLYLVENGIIKSRERAKEHIKNGEIKVNDKVVTKAAYDTSADDKVEFIGTALQYVGRGGLKLEKAIKCFKLDLNGICASSGSACTSGSLDPSHVLLALGLKHEVAHGSLRLSISNENTDEDIDYILEVVPKIVEQLRAMSPLWEKIIKEEKN